MFILMMKFIEHLLCAKYYLKFQGKKKKSR